MVTLRGVVLGYVGSVLGMVVAAAVSSRVSVTVAGVAFGAAVIEVFGWLGVVVLRWAGRDAESVDFEERVWLFPTVLFVVVPALFILGLVVAANVVPGLDVDGVLGYVILGVVAFGVSLATDPLTERVWPKTRTP